jgi:hypothetical protein
MNVFCRHDCRVCGRRAKLTCGVCKTWRYCSPECRTAGCSHNLTNGSNATSPGALCSAARTARLVASGRVVSAKPSTQTKKKSSAESSRLPSGHTPPLHIHLPRNKSKKMHMAPLIGKLRNRGICQVPRSQEIIPYQMLPRLATALAKALPSKLQSVGLCRIQRHFAAEVVRREVVSSMVDLTLVRKRKDRPWEDASCIEDVNTDMLEAMLCVTAGPECRLCGTADLQSSCDACQTVGWCAEHAETVQAAHDTHACVTNQQYQLLHRCFLLYLCIGTSSTCL